MLNIEGNLYSFEKSKEMINEKPELIKQISIADIRTTERNKKRAVDQYVELATIALSKNGMLLEHIDPELETAEYKKMVIIALNSLKSLGYEYEKCIRFIRPELLFNTRYINEICRKTAFHASDLYDDLITQREAYKSPVLVDPTANRSVILGLVRNDGMKLCTMDATLRNDKIVVMAAVNNDGLALQYASDKLRDDQEVVLHALNQDCFALQYASDRFKNDKKVVLKVFKRDYNTLQYASETLKNDREYILSLLRISGCALQYLPDVFKSDKKIVFEAVKQNGNALEYASEELKDDREIVETAIRRNGEALKYAKLRFRLDKEIILIATQQNCEALQYVGGPLRNDKELTLKVLEQHYKALQYASDKLRDDREIVAAAMKKNCTMFVYASERLRSDEELIIQALKNKKTIPFVSPDLLHSEEFILKALRSGATVSCLKDAKELTCNKNFMQKAIAISPDVVRFLSPELENDREISLITLRKDGTLLAYFGNDIKADLEVVVIALLNSKLPKLTEKYIDPTIKEEAIRIYRKQLDENQNQCKSHKK